MTDPILSLFNFRLSGADDEAQRAYTEAINQDGRIYITPTQIDGRVAIRFQVGQFDTTEEDVNMAYDVLTELA